jgi:Domain of unknown function (DUF4872)/Butirosin biosynthesis protein H, N-terminal
MTGQRHLKKLVRERMARTGESYTTARRHLLTAAAREHAPALPPGLVPGYDLFGGGQHRLSTLAAHLLRQAGHVAPHTGEPFSEAMVAGLAGGIGFMYAVFEYAGWPPMMTIVAQHHPEPWLPAVLGRLGIGYTEERGAVKPALAALHRALDGGQPVYCTVDLTALPWHAGELAHSETPYEVVVAGRHDGTLYLDDTSVAPLAMPEDEFAGAWTRHKKGRHHRIVLAPGPVPVDLPAAVRGALATTVAHLTGPVLGNSFDSNFGFSGMAKLAAQLRDTRSKAGWARRFGSPVNFFHGVRRLYECLELQFTAPGATRPRYADFLDEASPILGGSALGEAAALFRESGATWSALAARAADATAGLGAYTELCEERALLLLTRGRDAIDEVRALSAKIEELTEGYSDPLGDDGRAALFAELADLVDTAREHEERAVALL